MPLLKFILALTIAFLGGSATVGEVAGAAGYENLGHKLTHFDAVSLANETVNGDDNSAAVSSFAYAEKCYLESSTGASTLSSSVKERNVTSSLFYACDTCPKRQITTATIGFSRLLTFEPHALKLIYPYHHFW